MRTILVVEDEPQIAGLVRDYLEHAGFAVLSAGDGPGALALARARRPDALVLDLGCGSGASTRAVLDAWAGLGGAAPGQLSVRGVDASEGMVAQARTKEWPAAVELVVSDDAPADGRTVQELDLPEGSLVISVLRDDGGFVPKADTLIMAGDEVLIVLDPGLEDDITAQFVSTNGRG